MFKGVDGNSHAEEYMKLSERKDQGPWCYTFAKEKGYMDLSWQKSNEVLRT